MTKELKERIEEINKGRRADGSAYCGQFEGEPIETEYFWSMIGFGDFLQGMDDEAGTHSYIELFTVDDDERAAFGFDSSITHFAVEQSENGFITGAPMTTERAAQLEADCAAAYADDDDDEDEDDDDDDQGETGSEVN